MVFFRPMRSANWVTAKAPINEPEGMDATMAPWTEGLGYTHQGQEGYKQNVGI